MEIFLLMITVCPRLCVNFGKVMYEKVWHVWDLVRRRVAMTEARGLVQG